MGIAIKGVVVTSVSVFPNKVGKERITGDYSLMSNENKVLAKQGFNGYGDVEVSFSAETIQAMNDLAASLKKDVNTTLGIEED